MPKPRRPSPTTELYFSPPPLRIPFSFPLVQSNSASELRSFHASAPLSASSSNSVRRFFLRSICPEPEFLPNSQFPLSPQRSPEPHPNHDQPSFTEHQYGLYTLKLDTTHLLHIIYTIWPQEFPHWSIREQIQSQDDELISQP